MIRNTMRRVLVCANPDLNYIDGSSIWAQTITLVAAATGIAQVDFIAKSSPDRPELFDPLLNHKAIRVIDGTLAAHWGGKTQRRLTLPMIAELAARMDEAEPYDAVIVRGLDIARAMLDRPMLLSRCWLYLTDIPQAVAEYDVHQRGEMRRIALGAGRLLCQTQGFVDLWQSLVPSLSSDKLFLYTPVIPDLPKVTLPIAQRQHIAVYAGKFKAEWKTLEMASYWPEVHRHVPGSELVMIGDKIHAEIVPANYKELMGSALESTPGLRWLGALSRNAVQEHLQSARVGLSWRAESMNDTVEYSTKILEYGGAGCAAILNRNALHEALLGKDYPLYANSEAEFKAALVKGLTDEASIQAAADRLRAVAMRHTFSARVKEVSSWLSPSGMQCKDEKKTVLVAGHDLKFFSLLQKKLELTGKFDFLVDQWKGHNKHDEAASRLLLSKADVILCEWCLGNLQWYSENKLPHQRLVARFHLQERDLPYLQDSCWKNIDHISYVSASVRKMSQATCSFPIEKTGVIPNLLDENKFSAKTKTGDASFTLGMIGIVPARKRVDRALDLLEALLHHDTRYCLRVKGQSPSGYRWLFERETELNYFRGVYRRINQSPLLRQRVIFDPPGDDVNDWFTMVGHIISPSEFESFHMAVGEGMLANTKPVIWNWMGATEIWPASLIVDDVESAVRAVLENTNSISPRQWVLDRYATERTVDNWSKLLCGQ